MAKKRLDVVDEATKNDKRAKARELLSSINKQYKREVVKIASEVEEKEKATTPNLDFNKFIGGGFQYGNYSLVIGGTGAGKSTLMLQTIIEEQKKNKVCCFIDLEHKFDPKWAEKLGVNLEELILIDNIEHAEESMDIVNKLCKEGAVDLIVIDSLQAMSPKGQQETSKGVDKSIATDEMALLARKLSKFFAVTANAVATSKACVIIIAQVRMDLGGFIAKAGTSGGNAKDHWMATTLFIRRGAKTVSPVAVREFINPETGRKNTEKTVVGHDLVVRVDKDHVFGCAKIGSTLHIPFFYESGYAALPSECGVVEIKNITGEEKEEASE